MANKFAGERYDPKLSHCGDLGPGALAGRRGTVGILMYVHLPYGVVVSLFWRKTGNLVIAGLCHALGDAIQNGLIAGA